MFILDKPYVSDFLQRTAAANGVVLANDMSRTALAGSGCTPCDEETFVARCREANAPRIYSNSENAIDWIARRLAFTGLPDQIRVLKDKAAFRELLRPLFPEYMYQVVDLERLDEVDPSVLPKPFVIKPAVGFFSLGVHLVDSDAAWPEVRDAIKAEVDAIRTQYPEQVLDTGRFLIEQCIPGEEFAVDVYYDDSGEPVILNILAHLFASAHDVSDRVYFTSATLIERWLEPFTGFLRDMGKAAGLRNFPAHVELRVDDAGSIAPIEANPMRFAGWCVADLTWHAWGFNPYEYYLENRKPDWEAILADRRGEVTAVVVADIAGHIDRSKIESVDYEAFESRFSQPLELRRIDYRDYSVFAFLFARGREDDLSEFKAILGSDLTEFMRMIA